MNLCCGFSIARRGKNIKRKEKISWINAVKKVPAKGNEIYAHAANPWLPLRGGAVTAVLAVTEGVSF